MSDRFVRVYDAEKGFYWAANIDEDVRRSDQEKATDQLKKALDAGPLSFEQWKNFEYRLFPRPREPFEIHLPEPMMPPPANLPSNAISMSWLFSRYGRTTVEEMVSKRMIEIVPGYNTCVPNIPVVLDRERAPS